ncbi:hypothetical protein [Candidatus Tokpelaia sp.]|uniref:hypothetical protein n=1 Tax=Candidatus Tokpelaia sp. TaxID=2233777 RepID=UPI00123C0619|nr:hypothetical protein [Candidatus Tokpelaia sp.]
MQLTLSLLPALFPALLPAVLSYLLRFYPVAYQFFGRAAKYGSNSAPIIPHFLLTGNVINFSVKNDSKNLPGLLPHCLSNFKQSTKY